MKNLIVFIFVFICFNAKSQTCDLNGLNGYKFPVFGFISNAGDTSCWYLNQSNINSRIPMTIYTRAGTPLNHISAPPYSLCADLTDTSFYIKVLGTDSAGWFKVR